MTEREFVDAMRARIRIGIEARLNRGLLPLDGRWVTEQDLRTLERQRCDRAQVRYWELIAFMGVVALVGLGIVLFAWVLTV